MQFEQEPITISAEEEPSREINSEPLEAGKFEMAKLAVDMCFIPESEPLDSQNEKIKARISELSSLLGPEYDAQRLEIQTAIAELPIVGKTLEKDAYGEIADNGQEITSENIAFVRSADYLPSLIDGKNTVITAFEATRTSAEPVYRLTTHWTANHVVHDHTLGEFEGRKAIIIAPAAGMLAENGTPEAMLPVDTFWNKNVILPENSVILAYDENEKVDSVINLETEDDSEKIATLVLKAMGYSTVTDHPTYTETGFDKGVDNLAKQIGIIENRLHIDMETMETAIENFLSPGIVGESASSALQRLAGEYWVTLPPEVQKAAIDNISETSSAVTDEDLKRDMYIALENILIDNDEKYPINNRSAFGTSLPYEVLDSFIKAESTHWESQGEDRVEMVTYYIKELEKLLDKTVIDRLRGDNS